MEREAGTATNTTVRLEWNVRVSVWRANRGPRATRTPVRRAAMPVVPLRFLSAVDAGPGLAALDQGGAADRQNASLRDRARHLAGQASVGQSLASVGAAGYDDGAGNGIARY